jgi:hypothetical protein
MGDHLESVSQKTQKLEIAGLLDLKSESFHYFPSVVIHSERFWNRHLVNEERWEQGGLRIRAKEPHAGNARLNIHSALLNWRIS